MVENPTAELLRKATSGVKSCQANKKGGGGEYVSQGQSGAMMFQLTFTSKHLRQVTFAWGGLSVMKSEEASIVTRRRCSVGFAYTERGWRGDQISSSIS